MSKLKIKTVQGFKYTAIYTVLNGIINAILIVILGHLLGPNQLGLKSIATIVIGLAVTISQFGISQAIIQKDNINKNELNSLFVANLIIGTVGFLITFSLSYPISLFYQQPELSFLLKITSIIFLIEPITLVYRALLEKELELKFITIVNTIKLLSSSIVSVILAVLNMGALGFVIGHIVGTVISIVIIRIDMHKRSIWKPSFIFSIKDIKPYFSFGFFVTGKNLLNYFSKNFDEVIIGKMLSFEILGIYHLAKQVIDKLIELFTFSISKVTYPLFCKIREDISIFQEVYLRITKMVSFIGFPLFALMVLLLPDLIPLLFKDSEWQESIPVMQIFCLKAMIDILSAGFSSNALYAFNKPKKVFYIDLYLVPIRLLSLFIATFISIEAVAYSYMLFVLLKAFLLQRSVNNTINITMLKYFVNFVTPLIISLILLFGISLIEFDISYILNIILCLFVYLISYFLIVKLRYPNIITELKSILKLTVNKKRAV